MSRKQLEQKRFEIIKNIEATEVNLAKARKTKSSLLSEINNLEIQIAGLKALGENIEEETTLVTEEIEEATEKEELVVSTSEVVLTDYYELLRLQYKNKLLRNASSNIWSSKRILTALTKWRIFKTYEQMLIAKGNTIQALDVEIADIQTELKENHTVKTELKEKEISNLEQLNAKQAELLKKAQQLSYTERRFMEDISHQKIVRERFNQEIEQALFGKGASPSTTSNQATNNSKQLTTPLTPDDSKVIYNSSLEAKKGFLTWPMQNTSILKRYGAQANTSVINKGVTLQAKDNNTFCIFAGTVLSIKDDGATGKSVTIQHDKDYQTTYSNLAAVTVRENQQLSQNQLIGQAQTNANSMAELYFELRKGQQALNPSHWLKNN